MQEQQFYCRINALRFVDLALLYRVFILLALDLDSAAEKKPFTYRHHHGVDALICGRFLHKGF